MSRNEAIRGTETPTQRPVFVAWALTLVGIGMIGQWSFAIISGGVPELASEPVRIAFHLLAEGATAGVLLLAGLLQLLGRRPGVSLGVFGAGMLLYTSLVSPGYFAQQGAWTQAALFVPIVALAAFSYVALSRRIS